MPLPYPTNPNLQAVPVYQPGPLVKCGVRSAECGMRNGKASDGRLARRTL